jgi:hypothetical protein
MCARDKKVISYMVKWLDSLVIVLVNRLTMLYPFSYV